jgi:hypothetical protein
MGELPAVSRQVRSGGLSCRIAPVPGRPPMTHLRHRDQSRCGAQRNSPSDGMVRCCPGGSTIEASRVHHAGRQCGGVAAGGTGAASGRAGGRRFEQQLIFRLRRSLHSHARALFASFVATMAGSDFSGPCIIGVGSSPSRCGPQRQCHHGQTRDLPGFDAFLLHVMWPSTPAGRQHLA